MKIKRTPVDHGYAWVILVASFLSHTIQYGIAWTVGVFFDIFRVEFEGSNGAIALISSLNTGTFFMAGEQFYSFITICFMNIVILYIS